MRTHLLPLWRELVRRNAPLAWFGLWSLALFVLLGCLLPLAPLEVQGVNRWIKPMKFCLSGTAYVWTLGWLLEHLKATRRQAVRSISLVAMLTMLVEIVLITVQAARGVVSHFNDATPLDHAIFGVMGLAILINTVVVVRALVLFWRADPPISRAYLWGIRLGLLIFLLASFEGGWMVGNRSRYVAAEVATIAATIHPGLPFLNWSRRDGDLRVAHFVGLHALQVVPLAGFLLGQYASRRRLVRPVGWTLGFALGYALLAAGLFAEALAGRPLLALSLP